MWGGQRDYRHSDADVVSERERERAYADNDSDDDERDAKKPDARIGRSAVLDGAPTGAWTCARPQKCVWKVVKAALGLVHGEGGGTDGLDPCRVTRGVLQTTPSASRAYASTHNRECSPPRS